MTNQKVKAVANSTVRSGLSKPASRLRSSRLRRPVVSVLVALTIVAALVAVLGGGGKDARTVTAVFDQAVNVHEGDEVRILGVPVGRIERIEPQADRVLVTMTYDSEYALAQEATAAVVTPTLVSVRYVQLGPLAEDGDKTLTDNATIGLEQTASPLEWDDIKSELNDLVTAIGPENKRNGSLRRILKASASNLDGQGESLRSTLRELASAFDTLSKGRTNLFDVVRNLGTFVEALAANDAQVAQFNRRIATVSGVLSDNRGNLAALLRTLDETSAFIAKFIKDNRANIKESVADLGSITKNISQSRQALADVLQRTPIAASNLHNIYDPFSGSVTTSAAVTNFNDPAQFICGIGMGAAPEGTTSTQARRYCETALDPLLDVAQLGNAPLGVNANERDPDRKGGSR